MAIENAIIVRNKTRLEQLIERFNSKAQARFYIERSGGDFEYYVEEHETFYRVLDQLQQKVSSVVKPKVIERSFLPSFIFTEKDMVIVLGQDGLVANTAKYVNNIPIVAVNPDEERYDGVLLPFNSKSYMQGVTQVLQNDYKYKYVTMAEARMNDGQRLLAFNDFFIGASSHVSARYKITHGVQSEDQSSSGVLVSTGAGSTGWMSSVLNMASKVAGLYNPGKEVKLSNRLRWDTDRLLFVVREPFLSKTSQIGIGAGFIKKGEKLVIESYMANNGIIFSDGIEADFIQFNTGARVEIGIAEEKAMLVLA